MNNSQLVAYINIFIDLKYVKEEHFLKDMAVIENCCIPIEYYYFTDNKWKLTTLTAINLKRSLFKPNLLTIDSCIIEYKSLIHTFPKRILITPGVHVRIPAIKVIAEFKIKNKNSEPFRIVSVFEKQNQ